jgi:hypothetical protein
MPDTVAVSSSSAARAWIDAWADRRFRQEALLTAAALPLVLTAMARFLNWVERRPGVVLPDPVLAALPPRDLTWVTFVLVYAGILTAVAVLLPYPQRLLRGLQAYLVLVLLRMAVMAVTPLEAPWDAACRTLWCRSSDRQVLTKDLFFSGHTSTSSSWR